ncbi:MAG: hypothetical protein M3R24_19925 [Chloroflexota bacterium]|nr:hypothetical protein [Chloroflexota bacterium]PLS78483.1 MAG: hypothetical protein CYG59_18430 [Chloroflexota bacterium]
MATNQKPFTLRLPPELYEPIASMAERERRSLHNQVLYLLDRAIEAMEDAQDIRDAHLRLRNEETIPFEQALSEIEEQRRSRKA